MAAVAVPDAGDVQGPRRGVAATVWLWGVPGRRQPPTCPFVGRLPCACVACEQRKALAVQAMQALTNPTYSRQHRGAKYEGNLEEYYNDVSAVRDGSGWG